MLGAVLALAFLLLVATPATAQETGTVTGQIVEASTLEPLVGAQVSVPGTGIGGLTNEEGRYRLGSVPAGQVTVRVQMIGYETGEKTVMVAAGETAVVGFELGTSAVALDAIVVTGTAGGRRKRTLGNAVVQINVDEVLDKVAVSNVVELMQGRAPGVVITPVTGMVGSGSTIRIRGTSSLTLSGRPLVYVDGVRVSAGATTGVSVQGFGTSVASRLADFDPDDIKSIEIIKGPAAATLYGTEASNGVIQIITKKGNAGPGGPEFNLKIEQGANWFMNPEGRLPTNFWRNPATGEVLSVDIVNLENQRGHPIFRTGHLQSYDLSASGGAETFRYYVSGGLTHNEGAERDNAVRSWNGRVNLTITPSDEFTATANMGYVRSYLGLSCEGGCGGVMWSTVFAHPANLGTPKRGFLSGTPEAYYNAFDFNQEVNRFTGSLQLQHRPTDWFTQRLTIGTDHVNEQNLALTERSDDFTFFFGLLQGGKFAQRRNVTNHTLDYSGTFNVDLGSSITSRTSYGVQYYRTLTEYVSASGDNFPVPNLTVVDAAAVQRGGEDFVETRTLGIFGQQQFGWNDRLFLTVGLRADDNSAFGRNYDVIYYPKVSGSWVVSEAPFWNVPGIGTLRLRAAYGETGQQPAAFTALRTFVPATGPGGVPAVSPGAVGNPNLGPERGKEIEIGFNAGLLDGRIGVDFTYYNKHTVDAILAREVAPSTGFAGVKYVNIGEVANQGVELLVDGTAVRTDDVLWNLSVSFATNTNEIVSLGEGVERIVGNAEDGIISKVGYPVAGWWHRVIVSAEVNEQGRAVNIMCADGEGGVTPCFDAAGNPIAPRVYLGSPTPTYEGAFTSTLTLFDNLQFYAMLDYTAGWKKYNSHPWVRCSIFGICRANAFPQQADPVRLAAFQTSKRTGGLYIQDASYTKLRELSLSYTLPDDWAARLGAERTTISIAGRNLYTWTGYGGLDPEASYAGGPPFYEQDQLPQLASFVATINLSF